MMEDESEIELQPHHFDSSPTTDLEQFSERCASLYNAILDALHSVGSEEEDDDSVAGEQHARRLAEITAVHAQDLSPPTAGDRQWSDNGGRRHFNRNSSSSTSTGGGGGTRGEGVVYERLAALVAELEKDAPWLAIARPDMAQLVALRVQTLQTALEQLHLRSQAQDQENQHRDDHRKPQNARDLAAARSWLASVEARAATCERRLRDIKTGLPTPLSKRGTVPSAEAEEALALALGGLRRLESDHQLLQLEAQHDGQALFTRLEQAHKRNPLTRSTFDVARRRWIAALLQTLSLRQQLDRLRTSIAELYPSALWRSVDGTGGGGGGGASSEKAESSEEEEEEPPLKRACIGGGGGSSPREAGERRARYARADTTLTTTTSSGIGGGGMTTADEATTTQDRSRAGTAAFESCSPLSPAAAVNPPDVGYSSGEGTASTPPHSPTHSSSSEHQQPQKQGVGSPTSQQQQQQQHQLRIGASPSKAFYKTVPAADDELTSATDGEQNFAPFSVLPPLPPTVTVALRRRGDEAEEEEEGEDEEERARRMMSDSMIVHLEGVKGSATASRHGGVMETSVEYDEVLRLLDEIDTPTSNANPAESTWHGGTRWHEIGADYREMMVGAIDSGREFAKHSCDASSEGDEAVIPLSQSMSASITSERTPQPGQKRRHQRSARRSAQQLAARLLDERNCNSLLPSIPLDASIHSTRSDFPRRRVPRSSVAPRRLPRSFSQGQQEWLNGNATPHRAEFPGAATSTSDSEEDFQRTFHHHGSVQMLLRMQQQQNNAQEVTTDQPAYQWDDYHPPAKEERPTDADLLLLGEDAIGSSASGIHYGSMMACSSLLDSTAADEEHDWSRWLPASGGNKIGTAASRRAAGTGALLRLSAAALRSAVAVLDCEQTPGRQLVDDVLLTARTNLRQLAALAPALEADECGIQNAELQRLRDGWTTVLARASTPLSAALARRVAVLRTQLPALTTTEKTEGGAGGALNSQAAVRSALRQIDVIHERVTRESDELSNLLRSSGDGADEVRGAETAALVRQTVVDMEHASKRLVDLRTQLSSLDASWTDWQRAQERVAAAVQDEDQERCALTLADARLAADRLIAGLLDQDQQSEAADAIGAQLAVCAAAVEQTRQISFEILTPPESPKSNAEQQTDALNEDVEMETPSPVAPSSQRNPSKSSLKWRLTALVVGLSLAVLFCHYFVAGSTFGPHLHYVRGPPPT